MISRSDRRIIGTIIRVGMGVTWIVLAAVVRTVADPVTKSIRTVLTWGEPPNV